MTRSFGRQWDKAGPDDLANKLSRDAASAAPTPVVPTPNDRIFADHRQCGSPNGYDGCYSHPVSGDAHCRQDGNEWPCDVELLRAARSTPAEALLTLLADLVSFRVTNGAGECSWCEADDPVRTTDHRPPCPWRKAQEIVHATRKESNK